jgi:hypothetical protein
MFPNPPWWRKIRPVLQLTDCDYFGEAAPGWRRLCFFRGATFLVPVRILADARSFARNLIYDGQRRGTGLEIKLREMRA